MKKLFSISIYLIISFSMVGCGEPSLDGIILEVNENQVKLATELSLQDYEKIKDVSVADIQNEDVLGNEYRGLIDLTYDDTTGLSEGNQVDAWIDGDIMESYPLKATAKKISVK